MIEKATKDGVAEAFNWWLNEHPISMPTIVENAFKEKIGEWLDEHTADIVAQIARLHFDDSR